jgi:hypothetical protein
MNNYEGLGMDPNTIQINKCWGCYKEKIFMVWGRTEKDRKTPRNQLKYKVC